MFHLLSALDSLLKKASSCETPRQRVVHSQCPFKSINKLSTKLKEGRNNVDELPEKLILPDFPVKKFEDASVFGELVHIYL